MRGTIMTTTRTPAGHGEEPSFQHAADRLKVEGRRLADDARVEAKRVARERKDVAAKFLQDFGAATTTASVEMRNKGHGAAADLIDITAEEISHLGREIDNRDIGNLVREVEDFAQRRPLLFFGASLLAGFAAMRFIKASSGDDAETQGANSG
jgi:hypothetical protein